MKTLLILAALIAASAPAHAGKFIPVLAGDALELVRFSEMRASDLTESCEYLVGPQEQPEDTYRAMDCANTVEGFFIKRGTPDITTPETIACGAGVILNHAREDVLVTDILAAEFDGACEPATM